VIVASGFDIPTGNFLAATIDVPSGGTTVTCTLHGVKEGNGAVIMQDI